MRMLATSVIVIAALVHIAPAPSAHFTDTPEELVARLGSSKYQEREAASAALDKLGEAALPALRQAVKSPDAEVRSRATALLQRIEFRVESSRALASTKIRLIYNDTPLVDALKDLSTKTNLCILLDPRDPALRERKITLDTGATSLWQAFDQFCRKADLDETSITTLLDNAGVLNVSGTIRPSPTSISSTIIGLTDAKGKWTPATSIGCLRVRTLNANETSKSVTHLSPAAPRAQAETIGFVVEVTPEPMIVWQNVVGMRVTQATDDAGQKLVQRGTSLVERFPDPFFGMGGEIRGIGIWTDDTSLGLHDTTQYRHLVARLVPGEQPSKLLKEVQGTVTAEMLTKQILLNVDDPSAAVARSVAGPGGLSLKVDEVKRLDGFVTMAVRVSYKRGALWLQQGVLVRTDAAGDMFVDPMLGYTSFALMDAAGKELAPEQCEHVPIANHQGDPCLWAGYQLKFKLADAKTALGSLTYRGMRLLTVEVPFVLHDVPLYDDPVAPIPSSILHRALWKERWGSNTWHMHGLPSVTTFATFGSLATSGHHC